MSQAHRLDEPHSEVVAQPSKVAALPSNTEPFLAVLCGRTSEHLVVRLPSGELRQAVTTLALATNELENAIERGDRALVQSCGDEFVVSGLIRALPALPGETTSDESSDELVLRSNHRIVLRCGEASLTLTRDGRVLVRGKDVLSRARQRNQVTGAIVRLN